MLYTSEAQITQTSFEMNIPGDEKWVIYSNIIRKRSWPKRDEPAQTTSKAESHQQKIVLSDWWDYKGVVFWAASKEPDKQCRCLLSTTDETGWNNRKKRPLANRKEIVFHHDNTRPHTSLVTRGKLLDLGWEMINSQNN